MKPIDPFRCTNHRIQAFQFYLERCVIDECPLEVRQRLADGPEFNVLEDLHIVVELELQEAVRQEIYQ